MGRGRIYNILRRMSRDVIPSVACFTYPKMDMYILPKHQMFTHTANMYVQVGGDKSIFVCFMVHFHCRTQIRIQTRTQILVLCRYYGKGIRIWIWVSGNMFCIILCSYRVWNPNRSPNPSPAGEMSHYSPPLPPEIYITKCTCKFYSLVELRLGTASSYFH